MTPLTEFPKLLAILWVIYGTYTIAIGLPAAMACLLLCVILNYFDKKRVA